jgi:hypothetical protein
MQVISTIMKLIMNDAGDYRDGLGYEYRMIVMIQEDNVDCDDDDIIICVIFNDNESK